MQYFKTFVQQLPNKLVNPKLKEKLFMLFLLSMCFSKFSYADNIEGIEGLWEPDFHFYKPKNHDKFSNVIVTDLIEDSKGFLWASTIDGLNRYDGNSVVTYRHSADNPNSISSNYIWNLLIDRNNILWLATDDGLNIYDPNLEQFKKFELNQFDSSINVSKNMPILFEDSKNRLWTGSFNGEIMLISSDRKEIRKIDFQDFFNNSQPVYISIITESQTGEIIITTSNDDTFHYNEGKDSIEKYSPFTKQSNCTFAVKRVTTIKSPFRDIFFDKNNDLYLVNHKKETCELYTNKIGKAKNAMGLVLVNPSTLIIGSRNSGLLMIDPIKNISQTFSENIFSEFGLLDNLVHNTYHSTNQLTWLATLKGLNILNLEQKSFGLIKQNPLSENCAISNTVSTILHDSKNVLWVGTIRGGLIKQDLSNSTCEKVQPTPAEKKEAKNNNSIDSVYSLFEDKNHDVWIGTKESLFLFKRADSSIREINFKHLFKPLVYNDYHPEIAGIRNDSIYIGTNGLGILEFDLNTNTFSQTSIPNNENAKNKTAKINTLIFEDPENLFILASNDGLWRYNILARTIHKVNLRNTSLEKIIFAFSDKENHLWIATDGNGVLKLSDDEKLIRKYTISDGLMSNTARSIHQDKGGNIWLFTDKGLSRISAVDDTVHTFLKKDGLHDDKFIYGGYYDEARNFMWTGSKNGFNRFNPDEIEIPTKVPKILITDFELFYQSVRPSGKTRESPLEKPIEDTQLISLQHDQNVFAFTFSALEFISPERIKYKYMLEGYDTRWNEVDAERRYANYTNIDPGKYRFRVKASNTMGIWDEKEANVEITVAFPWWQSNLAYLGYLFLTIISVYLVVYFRTRTLQSRSQALEVSVNQRTQELATEKQKVEQLLSQKNEEFTNVSHEFRTPLTLVLGPIAQVLKTNKNEKETSQLNIAQRNGYRLLRMVDQLLNLETFRIQSIAPKIPLAFAKTIKLITEAFSELALEKNITIECQRLVSINFMFTPDALEKIMLNLISNAIKYTKSGGTILVESHRTNNNELMIIISDNGIGIPKDKLTAVFERYNRVLDENSELVTGAGIGLALVKELVEAHHGRIDIESDLGQGTKISITLPIINEVEESQVEPHTNNEVIAMELMGITNQRENTNVELQNGNNDTALSQPLILVIEDNLDMRDYIVSNLTASYRVITAKDGKEGITLAISEVPDLIISDVMMPNKDGYQTTHELREHPVTNHIPIILLTAKGDRESRLKGWQNKADEYLTKPFDVDELKVRVNNLLEIRDILKKRFGEFAFKLSTLNQKIDDSLLAESAENQNKNKNNTNEQNKSFINKLNLALEKLYSTHSLAIQEIAVELAMSERQFYRKLKSVLDLTPTEYLRRFRLEKSKELLLAGHNAGYVAIEVGFSSQSNFGKCFKAQFDLSPSEFKKREMAVTS